MISTQRGRQMAQAVSMGSIAVQAVRFIRNHNLRTLLALSSTALALAAISIPSKGESNAEAASED